MTSTYDDAELRLQSSSTTVTIHDAAAQILVTKVGAFSRHATRSARFPRCREGSGRTTTFSISKE